MRSYGRRSYDPLDLVAKRFNRRALVRAGAAGLAAGALVGTRGIGKASAQGQACGGEDITITYAIWEAAARPAVEEQIEALQQQNPTSTIEPQSAPCADH